MEKGKNVKGESLGRKIRNKCRFGCVDFEMTIRQTAKWIHLAGKRVGPEMGCLEALVFKAVRLGETS